MIGWIAISEKLPDVDADLYKHYWVYDGEDQYIARWRKVEDYIVGELAYRHNQRNTPPPAELKKTEGVWFCYKAEDDTMRMCPNVEFWKEIDE